MHWSLSTLARMLAWLALVLCVVAVGLGRSARRTHPEYHAAATRYQGVNMHCSFDREPQPCFLDRETGAILECPFGPGETLDYPVCSPWRDERGQFQAVARWMGRSGERSDYLPQEFGVARFTIPDGRVIDRTRLDHVPIGEPCWVPGKAPRIIYAAGDGALYTYDFAHGERDREADEVAVSQRLAWRAKPPGTGLIYIRDVIWPTEGKAIDWLIVSICHSESVDGRPRMSGPTLWWLRLDSEATQVLATGRLIGADPDEGMEERLPTVVAADDGELTLAYLRRGSGQAFWELRVAPIRVDPATGTPDVRAEESRDVARGLVPTAPAFSADGRWVYGMRGRDLSGQHLLARRFPVATVLAQAEGVPGGPGAAADEPAGRPAASALAAQAEARGRAMPPHDQAMPLWGWARLGILDSNWLVKLGAWRHAGE